MRIWRKIIKSNGRVHYLFCGVKVWSFSAKKKVRYGLKTLRRIQKKYRVAEKRIRSKVARGERVNVAFLVGMSSMFPARPLMECMLRDGRYNVSVIIIPDLRWGVERAIEIQAESKRELSEFNDNVVVVPVRAKDDNLVLEKCADIVFPCLPYDVSHSQYDLNEILKAGILPAIVNYTLYRSYYDLSLIKDSRYGLFWRVFAETRYNLEEYRKYALLKDENVVLTGYCKMDGYKPLSAKDKKTIMITPHHSLPGGYNDTLCLSNFDRYATLFLELPDNYPEINFIFRPHPALFLFLSDEKQWGQERVDQYIGELKSKKNVEYSAGGDYFADFSKSDALIGDCGSFLVEYFYTGKPQCYLLKDSSDIEKKFTELGKRCLEHCYLAYCRSEIVDFIDSVVLGGDDCKAAERNAFARGDVMVNYPNATAAILKHLDGVFFA